MNPYEKCPVYETKRFCLRQVRLEDAEALLGCYSDPAAVANMNADNCTGNFHMTKLEEMQKCIGFWLREYALGYYVRFSILDKESGCVIGTAEIFGGDDGVLRIDLPVKYETQAFLEELLLLAKGEMRKDFPMGRMCFKAHVTMRRQAAEEQGFRASDFRPDGGYYEI